MKNVEPVGLVVLLRSRTQCLAAGLGNIHSADPVSTSAVEFDPVAIAPNPASTDPDAVHSGAGDANAAIVRRNRVSALQRDAGEIDPGSRSGGDDDPALIGIRDAIAAGADLHIAAHLGPGLLQPGAGFKTGVNGER